MKVRAVILLLCFCGLVAGTESFTSFIESLDVTSQTCALNPGRDKLEEAAKESAGSCNEKPCCCGDISPSFYVLQKGVHCTPPVIPPVLHYAYLVNHYRMAFISGVWRPPAVA
jgi:hypothetical protein